jgi:three-Cys-motif partner protein
MAKHKFGGDWTTDKLERVRKYLCAYTTIFTRNPKAQYFTTIYVDAFAGTGHRVDPERPKPAGGFFKAEADPETEAYKSGSARIALEVQPPFDQFVFIERDAARAAELEQLVAQFAPKRDAVQIVPGEANEFLLKWCAKTDWGRHRAVVFLDPYGMQVDWQTLEALAKTKAIDLWLLFPLGVAVNRLLTRNAPPPTAWADALTRIFGTPEWQPAFYPKHVEATLFGVVSVRRKDVNWDKIGKFFVARLKTTFCNVASNPLPLRNSTNTPIYLLCFAAGNPRGAPTAVTIAQHVPRP